jgi:alkaline phosphatase D
MGNSTRMVTGNKEKNIRCNTKLKCNLMLGQQILMTKMFVPAELLQALAEITFR